MVLDLPQQLESALAEHADRRGVSPAALARDILERHLLQTAAPVALDDWERGLLAAARDCGVSLTDADLSSDGVYD